MQVCNFTYLEVADPVPFYELGMDRTGNGSYNSFIDSTMTNIVKVSLSSPHHLFTPPSLHPPTPLCPLFLPLPHSLLRMVVGFTGAGTQVQGMGLPQHFGRR